MNTAQWVNTAQRVIRREALRLCRSLGLRSHDREDLEQELWVAAHEAAGQYDPDKGSLHTYIDMVVRSAAGAIRRRRRRRKRSPDRPVVSLDCETTSEGDTPTTLGETVSAGDQSRRTGAVPRDTSADRETAEAVEAALSLMPDDVREIARRLMRGTVASVARDMGVSRRAIRRECRVIRACLERVGFEA